MSCYLKIEKYDYSSVDEIFDNINISVGGCSLKSISNLFRDQDIILKNLNFYFPLKIEFIFNSRYGLVFYSELQHTNDIKKEDSSCFIAWNNITTLWDLCFSDFRYDNINVIYSGNLEDVVILLSGCCLGGMNSVVEKIESFDKKINIL